MDRSRSLRRQLKTKLLQPPGSHTRMAAQVPCQAVQPQRDPMDAAPVPQADALSVKPAGTISGQGCGKAMVL